MKRNLLTLVLFCIMALFISSCGENRAEVKVNIPKSDVYPKITMTYGDHLICIYEVTDKNGKNFMIVRATGLGGGVSIIEVK